MYINKSARWRSQCFCFLSFFLYRSRITLSEVRHEIFDQIEERQTKEREREKTNRDLLYNKSWKEERMRKLKKIERKRICWWFCFREISIYTSYINERENRDEQIRFDVELERDRDREREKKTKGWVCSLKFFIPTS